MQAKPKEQDDAALLAALLAGELPDARGRFGAFGGRYVPETLVPALERLAAGVGLHLAHEKTPGQDQLGIALGQSIG